MMGVYVGSSKRVFPLYYSISLLFVCLTILLLLIFIFNISEPILLQPIPSNAVNVNSCGSLFLNDTYYILNNNLTATGTSCLIVEAYNSTIDGLNLYKISGNNAPNFSGIEVRGNGNIIKGMNITSFYNGILVHARNHTLVFNNIINGSDGFGINVSRTTNVSVINNLITYSRITGIFYLDSTGSGISSNLGIRNNIIQGINSVYISTGIHLLGSTALNVNSNKINSSLISLALSFANNNNFANNVMDFPSSNGIYVYGANYLNNFFNDTIIKPSQDAIFVGNSIGLNFSKTRIIGTSPAFYDLQVNDQYAGITLTDTYLAKYRLINTALDLINLGKGRIKFYPNITALGNNLSSDVKIGFNSVEVNSVNSPDLNKKALVSLNGLSTSFNSPIILRNGAPCPSNVCVNLTSLNSGTVLFNVTGWTTYSVGSTPTTPTNPTISIEEPDSNELYSTSAFPVKFVVELSRDGTAWFTLNNGTTNKTMNSKDLRNYTYNQISLSAGNYIMMVYANFTNTNFIANASVKFRVSSSPTSFGNDGSQNNANQNNPPNNFGNNIGSDNLPPNNNKAKVGDSESGIKSVAYWLVIAVVSIAIIILIFLIIKAIQAKHINKLTIPGSIVSQLR
jgi:hypothetical protein